MALKTRAERIAIAERRIVNILNSQGIATLRTLEQKISDAGPTPQRVEPFLLNEARRNLIRSGRVIQLPRKHAPWFHLSSTQASIVNLRLSQLEPIHAATTAGDFVVRAGQTLEIAVYKALRGQTIHFLGHFRDLDNHDDSTLYSKEEPPSALSGRTVPGDKRLDFLLFSPESGPAGIEVKNIREWMYPDRVEIRELLLKCCSFDAVPILIARRIPYVTFSVLNRCGCIIHQTYNQLYPWSEHALARQASDKDLLGYHDIRVGHDPDSRLLHFLHTNLPDLLVDARAAFDRTKDLLRQYADGTIPYDKFKANLPGAPPDDEET